jgi:hypothetical protein
MSEKKNRFNEIVEKCWADTAFKQRFLSDPRKVLSEYEIEIPAGLEVKVLENTPDKVYVMLPQKPGELTEGQLDAVSGGSRVPPIQQQAISPAGRAGAGALNPTLVHTPNKDFTCSTGKECVPW